MADLLEGLCRDCQDELAAAVESIQLLSRVWHRRSARAKRLLESTVAALVYYLPKAGTTAQWSGRVSRGLLAIWLQTPGVRPCRSHEIARSVTARALLRQPPSTVEAFANAWQQSYSVFSQVSREENRRRKHCGDHCETPAEANRPAGIELVEATREEVRAARRGDRKVIRILLERPTNYWKPPRLDA